MLNLSKKVFTLASIILFLGVLILPSTIMAKEASVAALKLYQNTIVFQLKAENNGTMLTVGGEGNAYLKKWFEAGIDPVFELVDNFGKVFPDGTCNYELSALPVLDEATQNLLDEVRALEGTDTKTEFYPDEAASEKYTQSGTFYIEDGVITGITAAARQAKTTSDQDVEMAGDQFINDDLIVTGSECVGFDCTNGMAFGFDTIVLKENNLRILFDDTSNSASFPNNDWRLTANDSSNGGENRFSIEDATGGRVPFTLRAGAPSHSLYVDAQGDVGLNTSNPVTELHIVDGDSPTVRLEQNGSSGFTPQTWDLAGNETNFFIRDVTNGSRLPFRIRPSAPTNSIYIDTDGDIGFGTASPDTHFEIERNGYITFRLNNTNANGGTWDITNTGQGELKFNYGGDATQEFALSQTGNLFLAGTLTTGSSTNYPDYVFDDNYSLMPLSDLSAFIKKEGHLPNIPTEDDVKKAGGVNISELQIKLLEKVEELTLYILTQDQTIKDLNKRINILENDLQNQE